ncbi:hypothetical protein Y032_0329g2648, partial [Ancylostoma ceylanicum]
NMGLVASCVLSVTADERVCKFCYGEDDQNGRWLRPCMCSGSLKWVHLRCFDHWMEKAPAQQQVQCQTCRYVYVKTWVLKPFSEWCRPAIKLSTWECIEIFLDTYSTYKFLRGFILMLEGHRSFVVQCLHFLFWRIFIATDRRLAYYTSLGRQLLSSIFEISVKDFVSDSDVSTENSSRFGSATSLNNEAIF